MHRSNASVLAYSGCDPTHAKYWFLVLSSRDCPVTRAHWFAPGRRRYAAGGRRYAAGGRRSCDAWQLPTGHLPTRVNAPDPKPGNSEIVSTESQSDRAGARPSTGTEGVAPPLEGVAPATPGSYRQAICQPASTPLIRSPGSARASRCRARAAAQERGPPPAPRASLRRWRASLLRRLATTDRPSANLHQRP